MSVVSTRAELAAACELLPGLQPTTQSATELFQLLATAFDGSTHPDSQAALSKLRTAVEAVNQSGAAYNRASRLLTDYGASM